MNFSCLTSLFLNILIIRLNTGLCYYVIKEFDQKNENYVNVNEELERTGSDKELSVSERRLQLTNVVIPCPLKNCNSNTQYVLEEFTYKYISRFKHINPNINAHKQFAWDNHLIKQTQQTCMEDRSRYTKCIDSKFRSFDGSCNNLERPNEGRTYTCLRRLLKPDYADGVKEPRSGVKCRLPEPRVISRTIHTMEDFGPVTSKVNTLHMSFGQFLDHDMEFIQVTRIDNITVINCCQRKIPYHPECFPLEIHPDDPDFNHRTCLSFVRNAACPTCKLGWREQMNILPSAIDNSQIYGTSEEVAMSLRTMSGNGELAVRMIPGVGSLPLAVRQANTCGRPGFECFQLGDFRINQNLLLTSLHVMFLRFHNFVARNLRELNPHWDGDRIYLESRRFVGACMQHITYEEYLPLLLGPEIMKTYHLDEINTRYDKRLSLSLFNYFAAAAFRFGHSTVPEAFITISETGKVGKYLLKDNFFNPVPFYQGKLEDLVRGSTFQYQNAFDRIISSSIGRYLFQAQNETQGLDLASINTQRGRDHGLPGYKFFVEKTHNFIITEYQDLYEFGLMSQRNVDKLRNLYKCDIEDVDLFVGLLSETRLKYSLVGPTAAHLIAKQFFNLKYGDRYFYTHRGETGSFTSDQIETIREVFLRNIICVTTEIKEIHIDAMNPSSVIVPCRHFQQINFFPWKE